MNKTELLEKLDILTSRAFMYGMRYGMDGTLSKEDARLLAETQEAMNSLMLDYIGEDSLYSCKCGEYHIAEEWWEEYYAEQA
jgi:hypothetical protein